MLRAAAGLVLGYLVMAGTVVILMSLAWMATGPGFAFRGGSLDTSTGWSLLSMGLGLVCAGFGGRVAARFSSHAVPLLAGVVFVLGLLSAFGPAPDRPALEKPVAELSVFEAASYAVQPQWYRYAIPLVGAAGVLLGGAWRRTRHIPPGS
ncbi:MAG: hypothetical protein Q7W56_13535 [Candidatus Latescibacteria bacterium]|nr:hypothetical protein [Candidatus Latescibacterota bacterium]